MSRFFLPLLGLFSVLSTAPAQPLRQFIDADVQAAWQREKITPASPATDAEFLRRIHLDLVGVIPSLAETQAFLKDSSPEKRDKLIERLLSDPRFATNQADVWDQVLFGRHPPNGDTVRKRDAFKTWLAEQFAKNVPYDRWVRDLLLAEQEGPGLFYAQYRGNAEETAVAVSRIFLGTQLQCARCHDHPYEKWTQKDFYGVAGFFVRLVVVESGSGNARKLLIGEKSSGDVLFSGPAAEQKPGKKGEPVKPKYLGGPLLEEPPLPKDFKEPDYRNLKTPPKASFSRKQKLAEWVIAPENPYFAKASVNRIWAQFLGRGLVHPVDDLSTKNKPSHPQLLDTLAKQFIQHKYDVKWLVREIVGSRSYQLASIGGDKDALPKWFERARVRPLSAEEMLASIRVATGTQAEKNGGDTIEYFARYFGEPANGQGEFQASLHEHLFLNNASNIRQMIQPRKGNLADTLLKSTAPWEERVEQMFLAVLSRPPRAEEKARFVEHLKSGPKPEPLVEEAIWALLNSAEFRFDH